MPRRKNEEERKDLSQSGEIGKDSGHLEEFRTSEFSEAFEEAKDKAQDIAHEAVEFPGMAYRQKALESSANEVIEVLGELVAKTAQKGGRKKNSPSEQDRRKISRADGKNVKIEKADKGTSRAKQKKQDEETRKASQAKEGKRPTSRRLVVQQKGKNLDLSNVTERCKSAWMEEYGKRGKQIREIRVTVNLPEGKAFWTVNGSESGSLPLSE
jgi:hypothetical protein